VSSEKAAGKLVGPVVWLVCFCFSSDLANERLVRQIPSTNEDLVRHFRFGFSSLTGFTLSTKREKKRKEKRRKQKIRKETNQELDPD
jgi:hypothetical protein